MNQLKSIQALRAIAAMAVMLAHLYGVEAAQIDNSPILSPIVLAGMSGVDLFFVISGFIMVWIAGDWQASSTNSAKFLFARIMRIYPVWWFFAGLMALYFWLTLGVPWDPTFVDSFKVTGPEHLLKSALLIPHETLPVLQLGWTLVHEMYFYVVFALLLLLPGRLRQAAMVIWAMIIAAAIFLYPPSFYPQTLMALILSPLTLEFLMGAVVAWGIKANFTRFAWPALGLGLAGLSYAVLNVDLTTIESNLSAQRMLFYGTPMALIVYALVVFERRSEGRLGVPSILVKIGDWSYSLYLCHLFIVASVARFFFPRFGHSGWLDNLVFMGLASACALAVAGLTYKLLEHPLLEKSRTLRSRLFEQSKPRNSSTVGN